MALRSASLVNAPGSYCCNVSLCGLQSSGSLTVSRVLLLQCIIVWTTVQWFHNGALDLIIANVSLCGLQSSGSPTVPWVLLLQCIIVWTTEHRFPNGAPGLIVAAKDDHPRNRK